MKLPVPVYGAVPPLADTVTVAVPPLHRMEVADDEAVSTEGSITVMLVVEVQPLPSVTV